MKGLLTGVTPDPVDFDALFEPIAAQAQTGILAVVAIGLGVFGTIFVIKRGKRLFTSVAS